MLKEGDKAPGFELPGDDGGTHSLKENKGKWVVLYFYPKDLTPGCTIEACDFNETLDEFSNQEAVVYGVSKDTLASHARFKSKHGLKFTLLSDVDLSTHNAYGAYGEKTSYGKTTLGVLRSTFLIDPKGEVAKIWKKVRVAGHVKSVMETLRKLSAKTEPQFLSKSVQRRPR